MEIFGEVSHTAIKEQRSDDKRGLRVSNTLLLISLLITVICAVVLYKRNATLKEEGRKLTSTVHAISGTMAGPPSAQVGDILPSFETTDSNGASSKILYDGKSKYLLYIFSPQCEVCLSEFPTWAQVANHARSKNIRVVALSIYPDSDSRQRPVGSIETMRIPSVAIQRAYRVLAVPTVILVSAQGEVEWVQYGNLSKDRLSELLFAIDK